MEDNKDNVKQDVQQGGIGRVNSGDPDTNEKGNSQADTADISNVDQQEGDMHNGSTGGNFTAGSSDTDGGGKVGNG